MKQRRDSEPGDDEASSHGLTYRYFQKGEYEGARTQTEFDVLDLRYSSGGNEVPGILIGPKERADRRWPAIIYNRSGTGDYGRLDHLAIVEMLLLA